jgi:hypothetical protein
MHLIRLLAARACFRVSTGHAMLARLLKRKRPSLIWGIGEPHVIDPSAGVDNDGIAHFCNRRSRRAAEQGRTGAFLRE